MNYQDFLRRVEAVQGLLGTISIPADVRHVGILSQIHILLNEMKDECQSCIMQEKVAAQEAQQHAE